MQCSRLCCPESPGVHNVLVLSELLRIAESRTKERKKCTCEAREQRRCGLHQLIVSIRERMYKQSVAALITLGG